MLHNAYLILHNEEYNKLYISNHNRSEMRYLIFEGFKKP